MSGEEDEEKDEKDAAEEVEAVRGWERSECEEDGRRAQCYFEALDALPSRVRDVVVLHPFRRPPRFLLPSPAPVVTPQPLPYWSETVYKAR